MSLVTSKGMLIDAKERNYAVGAFNANNIEMAQGIIKAAEEKKSPVIVQVSQGGAKYAGIEELGAAIKKMAAKSEVPVALHLDHGVDYKYSVLALRAGYTSIMFDGSLLDFEENVKITKKIVEMGHIAGVPVEAELGEVPKDPEKISLDELDKYKTKPEEAQKFAERTKVDSLAVAVGSMHKMKVQEAELDIEQIKKIKKRVSVPLVLHGSSGVTNKSVIEAINAGICKVNVHTHIAKSFTERTREVLEKNSNMVDLRKYLKEGREALYEEVKNKIQIFGSEGMAAKL